MIQPAIVEGQPYDRPGKRRLVRGMTVPMVYPSCFQRTEMQLADLEVFRNSSTGSKPRLPNSTGVAHQNLLTPSSDETPVNCKIPTKQLSGALWVSKFPTSTRLDEMNSAFAISVASFLSALNAAGASVAKSATLRPANGAFLMHWAWEIVNADADPLTTPEREGVDIQWGHLNEKRRLLQGKIRCRCHGHGQWIWHWKL